MIAIKGLERHLLTKIVFFYLYLSCLFILVLYWVAGHAELIKAVVQTDTVIALGAVVALYFASHVCRMFRLALLTLAERDKILPLISAHALTAFPSSFLPFKLGEIFRLVSFFYVYERPSQGFVIWFTERVGDLLILSSFIIGLQIFGVALPHSMRVVCTVFVAASAFSLIGLFIVSKIFAYLNRYFVLTSWSGRGLMLLQTSHVLRELESSIYRSVEGRMTAFLAFSVIIWLFEIVALSLFISHFGQSAGDFAQLFAAGMFASLPGGSVISAFGFYQSLTLVILTSIFLGAFVLYSKRRSR